MFIDWVRDPQRPDMRRTCATFASAMRSRDWPEMIKFMEPHLSPDVVFEFRRPYAAVFYNSFRAIVLGHIPAYWDWFMEVRAYWDGFMDDHGDGSPVEV
jgi:hypothetical protein